MYVLLQWSDFLIKSINKEGNYVKNILIYIRLRFILTVRSDFHMIDRLSIVVHVFVSRVSMFFSVDETLLPR